jgi:hypothetical protein
MSARIHKPAEVAGHRCLRHPDGATRASAGYQQRKEPIVAPLNEWLADPAKRSNLKTPALYRGTFAGDDPDTVHYDFNRTREADDLRTFLEGFGAADFETHDVTISRAVVAVYGVTDDYLEARVTSMLGLMSAFNKAGNGIVYLPRPEDATIRRGARHSETVAWIEGEAIKRGDRTRRSIERTGKVVTSNAAGMDRAERRALRAAPDAETEIRQVRRGYSDSTVRQLQTSLQLELGQ